MSESQMWEALRPILAPVHPVRVENRVESGTPDVNYLDGWIELKYIKNWPKKPEDPVRIAHFTPQQRTWLTLRNLRGGKAFLLLKVGESEWVLFQGSVAAQMIGGNNRPGLCRDELCRTAVARWMRKPRTQELLKWL